ncbi:TetR/AcrR family transcriptional regulator [candidate division KSB1 bacterium]|nr:TetR/AcrR family transcriptional regulator [candidate division KSB1 bacterium]
MPKKNQFTREAVVDTAVKIIREKGWQHLSARAIAQELDSSTMPIYSHLKSMDEIEAEIRDRAIALLQQYQNKHYTEKQNLNRVLGYLLFAREERNLYRFLFIQRPMTQPDMARIDIWNGLSKGTDYELPLQLLKGKLIFKGMDDQLLKSSIFIHGLASVLNDGLLEAWEVNDLEKLLEQTSEAFTFWAWQAKKRG